MPFHIGWEGSSHGIFVDEMWDLRVVLFVLASSFFGGKFLLGIEL